MRILRSAVNVHAFMIFIVEIFHSFFIEQRVEREREREGFGLCICDHIVNVNIFYWISTHNTHIRTKFSCYMLLEKVAQTCCLEIDKIIKEEFLSVFDL